MDYLQTKGRIFDIQRFSVHDGDGIRTLVFLKGCAMRCKWCCNPESQRFEIEKMTVAGVEKVIGKDVTVEEVLETVLKDRPYYRRSGGGVTLSGGECMLQPDFTRDLLRACKENGISTAVESMANVPFENIEKVLPYLDTYLMDIKHMNGAKHKEFTQRDNTLALENSKRVAESGACKLVIRVPVVPTFNDSEREIEAIASYAGNLKGVEKMHLLPYHRLGQDKYDGLNRNYELKSLTPPSDEKMERLRLVAEKASGIKVVIGG